MNDEYKRTFEVVDKVIQDLSEQIREVCNRLTNTFSGLEDVIRELPPQTKRVQHFLALRGWYLPGNCLPADIAILDDYIHHEDERAVEDFMRDYVSSELDVIKQSVCFAWSERSKILEDAFTAHEQGQYSLSIPVMLAQADGICHEILGVSFYAKCNSVPRTAKAYRSKLKEPVSEEGFLDIFFLGPLNILSSLAFNTDHRDKEREKGASFGPLNRHGVMHGLDTDYNTRANGLRVVALLDYLTNLKMYFK